MTKRNRSVVRVDWEFWLLERMEAMVRAIEIREGIVPPPISECVPVGRENTDEPPMAPRKRPKR